MAATPIGSLSIRILPDTKTFKTSLEKYLLRLERTLRVEIPAQIDGKNILGEAKRIAEEAERASRVVLDVTVEGAQTKLRADLEAQAKLLARTAPRIPLKTSLDKNSVNATQQALKRLGATLAGIGTIGKFTGFGAILGAATVNALSLTKALTPLAGLTIALPSLATGAAAALGTLKLALSGVGDAISAGFTGDAQKYAEALKGLAPAAKQAVSALVALKPQLTAVKTVVQQQFFEGINKWITLLGSTYLPLVGRQLGLISARLGAMVQAFARSATSADFVAGVSATLTALASALSSAFTAVGPLTTALGQLLAVGAPVLAQLGSGFATAVTKAADFISTAAASGQLADFLSNGLTVLRSLATLLGNVGSILGSVLQAASSATGNLLGGLSQVTGAVATFFNSAAGGAALTSVFRALADVGEALGSALGAVLPALGSALTSLAPILATVATALSPLIQALAPLLPLVGQLAGIIATTLATAVTGLVGPIGQVVVALGSALTPLLGPLSALLSTLATVITENLSGLASIVTGLLPALSALVGSLLPVVTAVIQALDPLREALLPVVAQLASTIGTALVPVFQQLGQLLLAFIPIIPAWVNGFIQILPVITQLIPLIPPVIGALAVFLRILTAFAVPTAKLVAGLISIFAVISKYVLFIPVVGMFRLLAAVVGGIVDGFKKLGSAIASVDFGAILSAIGGFFSGVGSAIGRFFTETLPNGFATLVSFLAGLPAKVGAALLALPGVVASAIKSMTDAALFGIGFLIGSMIKELLALPGQVAAIFTSLWETTKSLFSAGAAAVIAFVAAVPGTLASLWTSAKNATVAQVSAMWDAIVGFFSRLPGMIGGWVSSAWSTAKSLFSAGVSAVVSAAQELPGRVGSALSGLVGSVKSALSAAGTWLYDAGRNIIFGLIDGIKSAVGAAIDAVKHAMGEVVSGAKKALGISSPSKVFARIGEFTVEGYVKGLKDNADVARNVVSDLLTPAVRAGDLASAGAPAGGSGATYNFYPREMSFGVREFQAWLDRQAAAERWERDQ